MTGILGTGEIAALSAAALWALSSLFYGRTPLTAWQMNFGKNCLATLLLCAHLGIATGIAGRSMFAADANTWLLLGISSVIGILAGDTFYFRSLQILGPRRALIVSTTSPLFATIIGWFTLEEPLSPISLMGILMTLGGISFVVSERGAASEVVSPFPASATRGILMGLGGAICNACGATFSRLGTQGSAAWSASGCDPLEATLIRVSVAAASGILMALLTGRLISTAKKTFHPSSLRFYGPAVFVGPWLGIWMSQIAYKHCLLAIAITLTSTTPLFVMPMLRVFYGQRITLRAFSGALVALAGIYLTVAGDSGNSVTQGNAGTRSARPGLHPSDDA